MILWPLWPEVDSQPLLFMLLCHSFYNYNSSTMGLRTKCVYVCFSAFHVCLCFSEILQEEDVSFSIFFRNIDPNWAQEGFPYYTSRSVESCFPGVMFLWFPSVIFELSKLQRKHGVSHQRCRVKNLYRYLTWSWLAVIRLLFFTLKL